MFIEKERANRKAQWGWPDAQHAKQCEQCMRKPHFDLLLFWNFSLMWGNTMWYDTVHDSYIKNNINIISTTYWINQSAKHRYNELHFRIQIDFLKFNRSLSTRNISHIVPEKHTHCPTYGLLGSGHPMYTLHMLCYVTPNFSQLMKLKRRYTVLHLTGHFHSNCQ